MKYGLGFGAGLLLALFLGLVYYGAYKDGQDAVIRDCMYYGKHGIDGTELIYCAYNPDAITIKIFDTKAGKKR